VEQGCYLWSARFQMKAPREDIRCYMAQHGICLVEVAYLITVLKVKSGDMLAEAQ
jgi:hypothetical protein